jgi:molybdate transport repressor ModE-like protein
VTLTQLEAFVLVARLGSVTAAARTLGVSEPAVSAALATLRQQFEDPLIERGAGRMTLTAGGRRLLPIASQMVTLAAEAEEVVRHARGAPERIRVVATSSLAESVAPALLAAFTARAGAVDVSLGVVSMGEMEAVLQERLADVALGPRIFESGLETVPVFRYRLALVTAPSHHLARMGRPPLRALPDQTWLVDADVTDPATPVAALLRRLAVPERNIRVFPSQAAAWAAASEGQGVAPAVAHLVAADLARGSLVVIATEGMPLELLWHATMLSPDRRSPAVAGLRRFMETPEATHAMHAATTGVPPSRFRPPVYVTLWS